MATERAYRTPGRRKTSISAVQQGDVRVPAVWFAIFFIALYVIISRLAIPRIGGIIEARRGRIEGDLAEANRLKEQSDAALKAYEKSLADARNRAQALANETRDKLNAEAEEAAQGAGEPAQR